MALSLNLLPGIIYAADASTRNDASNSLIVSERDYVSSWLCSARNLWRSIGGEVIMHTLPQKDEQITGCDALIILRGRNVYKYIFFEAKQLKSDFDKNSKVKASAGAKKAFHDKRKSPKYSRFCNQIGLQADWLSLHKEDTILEAFLNFDKPYSAPDDPFDHLGSTIIKHDAVKPAVFVKAHKFNPRKVSTYKGLVNANKGWSLGDVFTVCNSEQFKKEVFSIDSFIRKVVKCEFGKPISLDSELLGYRNNLPLIGGALGDQDIAKAMESLGVSFGICFFGEFDPDVENRIPKRHNIKNAASLKMN